MTEKKRPESQRKESLLSTEEQLALAIEALSEHVVLFDAEDRVVIANQAWRTLNEDIVEFTQPGTRFEDHLRATIRKGLVPQAVGREEEWLKERLDRHRNPRGPFEVARQDGRWIRVYEQRLPNNGTILIISDVTESKRIDQALRESEERFHAVVDNSPAKIHIKDAAGRYILINPLAEKLFGVTEAEASGKTTHEVFPRQKADSFAAHDQSVLETGQAIEQEEEWRREDGVHTYLTVKFPILNAAGEVTGVGAIGTDITDRKQAEERLRQSEETLQTRVAELEDAKRRLESQGADLMRLAKDLKDARDQAESASRAKSEFLAAMSHELRTPLNAIIGFSEVMKEETLGPVGSDTYRDYVKGIHESGQHLLALINDILDLSKIDSGMDELHEEDVDVPELIQSVMRLVRQPAHEGKIELDEVTPRDLPALLADERKLKQMLVNLLTNAVKFTKPGGKVTLRAWCDASSGYGFEIADTGIGIAPEDLSKALSRFGQVDSDLNRRYQGTGLGLPLTKVLVEAHGGELDLQSEVGVGTTVTIRFPATRTADSQRDLPACDLGDREAG